MKYTWDTRKIFDVNYIRYKFKKIKNPQKIYKSKNYWRFEILNYCSKNQCFTGEYKIIVEYLKKRPFDVFPYPFMEEYKNKKVEVLFDNRCQLYYVLHDQKPLYIKQCKSKTEAKNCYIALLKEQDDRSPHCYVTPSFNVSDGDVVADIGAAEGIFGLIMIDKVKHLYIFEPEKEWVKALEQTFAPYKNKVTIVNKFVSDEDSETQISLDTFFLQPSHQPNFLKIDIEGYEKQLINGARKLIDNVPDIKIVLCTYHRAEDFSFFENYFKNLNFYTEHTDGYMLFYIDKDFAPPYFRRGILRIKK